MFFVDFTKYLRIFCCKLTYIHSSHDRDEFFSTTLW